MPVDIAGFTGHKLVLKVFMEHVAKKVDAFVGQGPGAEDKVEVDLNADIEKPVFNEIEHLGKLKKSEQTGQFKVPLEKQTAKELTTTGYNEPAAMRVFYWAAYYGKSNFVIGYMILLLKWSPFIKSYMKQSVLTAAIRGKQTELIRKMANFMFVADQQKGDKNSIFEEWVVENWYGKDLEDNNPLHYAYLSDLPDIRQILRQSKFEDVEIMQKPKDKRDGHA